jgi:hypothetical protein
MDAAFESNKWRMSLWCEMSGLEDDMGAECEGAVDELKLL